MKYKLSERGIIVQGNAFDDKVINTIDAAFSDTCGQFPLIICDPPYGEIVNEEWDKEENYYRWMKHCASSTLPNAVICMWGGIGKPGNRPFLNFIANVESWFKDWKLLNLITWGKKRAYGVKNNYLFTREECAILTRGEPTFNIPLLKEKRGYAGYNPKYPAKSEYLRRTNIWTDINELFRNKIHQCQKPDKLYEVLIETHSNKNDIVYDPCAGSLTTMRAAYNTNRRYAVIERELINIEKAGVIF